MGIQQSY